jgi:putative oxidoreductase
MRTMNWLTTSFLDWGAVFATRCLIVLLFFPFSAMDKVLNFAQAVGQAAQIGVKKQVAIALICAGLCIEVIASIGVLTGVFDRMAALVLALYCIATALLWKQFWKTTDFRLKGFSKGRDVFWDFFKNLAVAGGFLMLAFGPNVSSVHQFFQQPWASTHPYADPVESP